MDRIFVYPGALVQETDSLNAQRNAMVNDGALASAFLDIGTWLSRLYASPTNPPSMSVIIGDGTIYSWTTVDSSAFSSLPMDARGNFKIGINLDPTVLPLTAPTTPGYSVNYLVAGCLSETDDGSGVIPYFNAAAPNQPYMGPQGSGAAQFSQRNQRVGIELISGVAAPAGSETTPAAPVGWVPMYIITINAGATSVAPGDISVHPNAPFLRTKLNSMASGAQLAAAIADFVTHGQLNAAVAPLAPLASPAFSGAPTVPSPAAGDDSAQIPNTDWVRARANEIAAAYANSVRFPEAGVSYAGAGTYVYTVPAGVTRIKVYVTGGGAGGNGCDGLQAGSAGGAGGTAIGYIAVYPGQQFLVTVGAPGASGLNQNGTQTNSGAGGTSSFGSVLTATGGSAAGIFAGSAGGMGYGGHINLRGGCGTDCSPNSVDFGGNGGASHWGGGGRAARDDNSPETSLNGQAPGSGGGGGYGGSAAGYGGAGAPGIVVIEQ